MVGSAAKVYFVAPPNTGMEYPCIVYKRDDAETRFANNRPYTFEQRYQLTLIDRKAENDILPKIAALPKSRYERNFVANNLHHDVFVLYF